MASFTKRGKTWQYTISRMVNGKSKPIRKGGFKTKREAQAAAADIESKMNKGFSPITRKVPFNEYFEAWIKTYKTDIKENTLARYNNSLDTINEYFNDTAIQDITKRSYQSFLNEYAKNHAKETTRKLNTHIRSCVLNAIDEGIIHINFTRGAVVTGKQGKSNDEKYLNYDESQKLLNAILEKKKKALTDYLIILALTSGMRFGEMVGLTRKDFDFDNNTININKTWGYTNKMHKGWGETKTGEQRVIKMDTQTMGLFQDLFERRPENIKKLVFYSPTSKYHVISNSAVNKQLREMMTKLDIKGKEITIHSMRHTHASVLLYQGVSFYYVSKRLGHKDIETTLNTYSHVIKEMEERDENMSAETFQRMYV